MQSECLLFSLLSGDSGTLAIFDEAVLSSWKDAAHGNQALNGHEVEVDLEQANIEGLRVDLINVVSGAGSRTVLLGTEIKNRYE